jgi:hypothetical protein
MSIRWGFAAVAGWATAAVKSLSAVAPSANAASAPASTLRRSGPVAVAIGAGATQQVQPRNNRRGAGRAAMIHLLGLLKMR